MVCNTRTDSVADLLSSTEGRKRSVFFSFQRVVIIVSVQTRCLFCPHYQRSAKRSGANGLYRVVARKKNRGRLFFLESCRKIDFFSYSFCLANVFGRRVLSTVINNTIIQIVCS